MDRYTGLRPPKEIRAVLRGKVNAKHANWSSATECSLDRCTGRTYGITAIEPRTTLLERRVPEGRGSRPVRPTSIRSSSSLLPPTPSPSPSSSIFARRRRGKRDPGRGDREQGGSRSRRGLDRPARRAGYRVHPRVSGPERESRRWGSAQGTNPEVAGPSGAGKSSFLNAVEPGLRLRTGELSARVGRGKSRPCRR